MMSGPRVVQSIVLIAKRNSSSILESYLMLKEKKGCHMSENEIQLPDAKFRMIQHLLNQKGVPEVTIKIHKAGRTDDFPENLRGDIWIAIGEGGDWMVYDELPVALEALKKWLFAI
jgi:hypothetical protein